MNKRYFDLRSFLLVLAAIAGNAQIKGIDITLALIMPALLLLLLIGKTRITLGLALLYCLYFGIMTIMTGRAYSIGIPYFDAYWVWPIKAALLAGAAILIIPHARWPSGNHLALLGICLFMLVFARYEGGRMHSLFGPNMLYRLFGLLLVLSALMYHKGSDLSRPLLLGLFVLGLVLSMATGSTGAIPIVILGCAIMFWGLTWRNQGRLVMAAMVIAATSRVIGTIPYMSSVVADLAVFSRLHYKIQTITTSSRFNGWDAILDRPLGFLGYNYDTYSGTWFFGYAYPHNIFVELLAFYGYLGLAFNIIILAITALRPLPSNPISATLLVILLGSLLSGDLSDNYSVIAFSSATALLFLSGYHRRKRTPTPSMRTRARQSKRENFA